MTATTMRFGPEWMRKQPAPTKPHTTSSPPPSNGNNGHTNGTPAPPGAPSYSALVTPHVPLVPGKRDLAHPFKYSRDEMLQFYKDSGGHSELPIEVERWEGIVREPAGEPACLHDLTEAERKLFTSSINSELRRRQSTDYMTQGDRSKGGPLNTGMGLMGRRRRGDSNGTDHPPLSLPRKTSWSGAPGSLTSPALASPRTRMGSGSGFDGILNGSNDTAWGGGKRRNPSGQPFSGRVDEEEETQRDPGASDNKNVYASKQKPEVSDQAHPREPDPVSSSGIHQDSGNGIKDTTTSMNNLTLNTNLGAPPGELSNGGQDQMETVDLGKQLWSYIDPSGNVQGPFPGETMQLWHGQKYFTDNLLMKRASIDAEFFPLSEIKRRAQGELIFLSPLSDNAPPPGLGPMSAGPRLNSILHRTGIIDAPHQPSPQGYGRSNVLDFINAGSTATGSASPSSSFGGNLARGPVTPDPAVVGSRLQRLASDNPMNGRTSAADSYSSHSSPAMPHAARHSYNEPIPPNRGASFDAQSNVPWQMQQTNGFQGWNGSQDMSQFGQPGRLEPIIASPVGHSQFARDSSPYMMLAGQHTVDPFLSPSAHQLRFFEQQEQIDMNARRQDFHGSGFQHAPNEAPLRFVGAPQQLSMPQSSTGLNRGFEQPMGSASASPSVERVQQQYQNRQGSPLSPWGVPQTQEPPRPRPFDDDQPTSSNTFVIPPPQKSAWDRPQVESRPPVAHDPWAPVPQANSQEAQGQEPHGSASLTMANVIQHNEQQARNTSAPVANDLTTSVDVTIDAADTAPPTVSHSSVIPSSPQKESVAQPPAPKRKSSHVTHVVSTPEKPQPQSSTMAAKPPATTPVTQKAAWATDDDIKAKLIPTPMNLREIQEVEKKKQEARRAAEKERERAARATAISSSTEEVQFTASWGLPTSQVGSRNATAPAAKDAPALSPSTTSAHVWTSAAKPAAKTMKEIQEEEERRKQQAVKAETIASAAKRAVQTPAAKGPLTTAQATGGAWTVVGSGGKGPIPASVVTARPAPVVQTSTSHGVPARPAAVTSNSRTVSSSIVTKAASSAAKVEEEPSAPSLEFLKWMRDNLKGLNSSVQFEEFAQMLLSFPLDPDQPTVELIADAVYAASTTLDGRRFAKEFVDKRKQDARSRPRAQGQASNGKVSSLADVVKAQPKPAQNEFGGYKVVKKKNKRG